ASAAARARVRTARSPSPSAKRRASASICAANGAFAASGMARPWRQALRLARALPAAVRGPVLLRALRRVPAIWPCPATGSAAVRRRGRQQLGDVREAGVVTVKKTVGALAHFAAKIGAKSRDAGECLVAPRLERGLAFLDGVELVLEPPHRLRLDGALVEV